MAKLTNEKLITLQNLTDYSAKVREYVKSQAGDAAAASIKTIAYDATAEALRFYKEESKNVVVGTTTPVFSQTIKKVATTAAAEDLSIKDTANIITATDVEGALAEIMAAVNKLNDADTVAGSVAKSIKDAIEKLDTTADVAIASEAAGVVTIKAGVKEVDGVIAQGDGSDITLAKVATTGKAEDVSIADSEGIITATTVEDALTELAKKTGAGDDNYLVSVSEASTSTSGMLKSYEIFQGKNADKSAKKIATIDIPKDFLVKSAAVVKDPTGQAAGTYIDFVINSKDSSATDEHIYLNVKDLVDVYTAKANASQVQLTISSTNEISAEIVDGSVDTDALKDDAVTAAKIADDAVETAAIKDAQVTAAKLAANSIAAAYEADGKTVKSSTMDATTVALLQLAHDSVQEADVTVATKAEVEAIWATTPAQS